MKKRRLLASILAFSMLFGNGAATFAEPAADDMSGAARDAVAASGAAVDEDGNVSYDKITEIGHNLNAGEAYSGTIGQEEEVNLDTGDKTYADMLEEYEKNGYKSVSEDTQIVLDIDDVKSDQIVKDEDEVSDEEKLKVNEKGKLVTKEMNGIKFYDNKEINCSYVEWDFDVDKEGLYEMYINLKPEISHGTQIQRRILIDGEVPFEELRNVYFFRRFKEADEVKTNAIGNEVWPSHVEVTAWQQEAVVDNSGYYADPLEFYFSKGQHTIRIEYVDQNFTIGDVILKGKTKYPTYKEYLASHKGAKDAKATIKIQAEEAIYKSESTIRRDTDTDPMTESLDRKDYKKGKETHIQNAATEQLLNMIGGSRWSGGNQSITWKIEVEEEGFYTINARASQADNTGMPAFRQIEIDGAIPFEELKLYPFEYNEEGWAAFTIGDHDKKGKLKKDGEYKFFLSKGVHELTMTVKSGTMYEIESLTNKAIQEISEKYIEITKVTGTSPDENYAYHLERDMKYLKEDFNNIADQLQECSDLLAGISYIKSDMETNYDGIIATMRGFADDLDTIVSNLGELESAQTNLGDYLLNLGDMPLKMDYIEIRGADIKDDFQVDHSNFWHRLWYSILNFFASFIKEYDAVGSVADKDGSKETLEVWIARGREWGEILKSLADEDFAKKYGIEINLNILPSGQLNAGNVNALMLAITSGHAPDIGMGVSASEPVEFAFREAVVDLSKFNDFEDYIKDNFPNDTMMVPYQYKHGDKTGIYGLPETMDFTCVIYRTDIFQSLNLQVPETWDELWKVTLPELDKNNMSFSFPVEATASSNSPSSMKAMTMFLIQNGGSYYTDTTDAKEKANVDMEAPTEGKYSNLDTDAAVKSFQQWCEMYTNYGIDAVSSFFSRFRTGTLPIGECSYASYMQILTTAPELYGRWSLAPMIGSYIEDENGELYLENRVTGISLTACQIMTQSEKQKQSWEFLKWWMSEETQVAYGQDIEATMGVTARWNTANIHAFQQLPWNDSDIEIITDSISTAIEQPIVLGGYFTPRHLYNAWNRVYMNNVNPRESLEEAVKDINKELRNKHEEYGFTYDD